jgi:hypothetical protein
VHNIKNAVELAYMASGPVLTVRAREKCKQTLRLTSGLAYGVEPVLTVRAREKSKQTLRLKSGLAYGVQPSVNRNSSRIK